MVWYTCSSALRSVFVLYPRKFAILLNCLTAWSRCLYFSVVVLIRCSCPTRIAFACVVVMNVLRFFGVGVFSLLCF